MQIVDGFDSPVGSISERQQDTVWPGLWYSLNNYGSIINNVYHTGEDLTQPNLLETTNSIYASANGIVTFAGRAPLSTWDYVVIIQHKLSTGDVMYTRYGQLSQILVQKGQTVVRGQEIGSIFASSYVHFDISTHPVQLLHHPATSWCKTYQELRFYYVNPIDWIASHRPSHEVSRIEQVLYITPNDRVILYARPGKSALQIRRLPQGASIFISNQTTVLNGEIWRKAFVAGTQEVGWISQDLPQESQLDTGLKIATVIRDVKLLEEPKIGAKLYQLLKKHDKVILLGQPLYDGEMIWSRIRIGDKIGWSLLAIDTIVFIEQKPIQTAYKIGLHIYPGSKEPRMVYNKLLTLARSSKLAGVVVVDNISLANQLANENIPHVVHRAFADESVVSLDAKQTWDDVVRRQHGALNKRVIILPHFAAKTQAFWDELGQIATSHQRNLATPKEVDGHYFAIRRTDYQSVATTQPALVIEQKLTNRSISGLTLLNTQYANDRCVKAFMVWTIGGYGAYEFDEDSWDDLLEGLINWNGIN